jgi:2-dehydropantoate 2-reductase
MRFLLQEISQIIRALPELQTIHNIEKTFGVKKLEARVISSIEQTGKNVSSMLQDVRDGKKTDIDFYNGYLVHRAMELGIDCPRNQMLLHLVKGRQAIKNRMKNLYIPFRDEY